MKPNKKHVERQIRIMQDALNALADTPPKQPTIIKNTGKPQ